MTTPPWKDSRPECPDCGNRVTVPHDHNAACPLADMGEAELGEHLHYVNHTPVGGV